MDKTLIKRAIIHKDWDFGKMWKNVPELLKHKGNFLQNY